MKPGDTLRPTEPIPLCALVSGRDIWTAGTKGGPTLSMAANTVVIVGESAKRISDVWRQLTTPVDMTPNDTMKSAPFSPNKPIPVIRPEDKPLIEQAKAKAQPTAGALRAAKAIKHQFCPFAVTEEVAALIDAATGLPELVAALEAFTNCTQFWQDADPKGTAHFLPQLRERAHILITKTQRTSP